MWQTEIYLEKNLVRVIIKLHVHTHRCILFSDDQGKIICSISISNRFYWFFSIIKQNVNVSILEIKKKKRKSWVTTYINGWSSFFRHFQVTTMSTILSHCRQFYHLKSCNYEGFLWGQSNKQKITQTLTRVLF